MEPASLDSIVLKRVKFGDTSIIATLFTREQGKISVIAKGARAFKSNRGLAAALEPLNRIEAVVLSKSTRDIQILSSAEIIEDFYSIKQDYDRMEAATRIALHLDRNLFEKDISASIWADLLSALENISTCEVESIRSVELKFRADLLASSGFAPFIQACSICGKTDFQAGFFSASHGGLLCPECASGGIALDQRDIEVLNRLFQKPPPVGFYAIPNDKINKIEAILKHHAEFHTGK